MTNTIFLKNKFDFFINLVNLFLIIGSQRVSVALLKFRIAIKNYVRFLYFEFSNTINKKIESISFIVVISGGGNAKSPLAPPI